MNRFLLVVASIAIAFAFLVRPVDHQGRASKKSEVTWQAIQSTTEIASWYSALEILGLFFESMNPTFDLSSDWLPNGRKKLIHSQGLVAKFKWVPYEFHPYTGLFESGGDYGILRVSLAKEPPVRPGEAGTFVPGLSVKLFRDNRPSANFMAMFSLDGQESWNFFENQLSNHVNDPNDPLLKLVAKKFRTSSKFESKLGLSDFARYNDKGVEVTAVKMPHRLFLKPNIRVRESVAPCVAHNITGPTWYRQFDCVQLDEHEDLYRVFAEDFPGGPQQFIGAIMLTSDFIPSEVADRQLFFQHVRMEEDYKLRPDWLKSFHVQQ